jgi:hypothetical protein
VNLPRPDLEVALAHDRLDLVEVQVAGIDPAGQQRGRRVPERATRGSSFSQADAALQRGAARIT